MASPNRNSKPVTYRTVQEMFNNSYDEVYKLVLQGMLGYRQDLDAFVPFALDSSGKLQVTTSGTSTQKILWDDTTTANTIYVGKAALGTATSAASWQINKVGTSSKSITWAASGAATATWDNRATTETYT